MKNIKRLILLMTLFVTPLSAQDETIRIETDLVNVSVTVLDKNGDFIKGLTNENFEIFDNGIKQKIEYFSAEDAGVSYGIVYDMHPTTDERTQAVLESLREFTNGLRDRDDFFTLVFSQTGSLILDFVPTAGQINTHLSGKFRQPNALYDAIYLATDKIRERRNLKKVLLIITDSADHNSEHRFNDILGNLKTLDTQVYAVVWDASEQWNYADITRNGITRKNRVSSDASGLDRAALAELAFRTGGTMQSPTVQNAGELFKIYTQISQEAQKMYSIGFYPERSDGKWHELVVKLRSVKKSRKPVLTYRPGYQSPKPD